MDKSAQTITLEDGRTLGYAEYGDPQGKPVFLFHGWPSSRRTAEKFDDLVGSLHIRLISPDRPGYGLSDFKANRKMTDWPDDVTDLANVLNIRKFAIIGISGGGPYAAVCGYKIPERITKLGIVVGVAPIFDWESLKGMTRPAKLGWVNAGKHAWVRRTVSLIQFFSIRSGFALGVRKFFGGKMDKSIFQNRVMYCSIKENYEEAFRQGYKGPELDLQLYTTDWGFDMGNIHVQTYLWYGTDDHNVSKPMARYYRDHIKGSTLTLYPGEGHMVLVTHAAEILQTLI